VTPADLDSFRERLKLNRVQLARLLGISRDRLRRWEEEAVPIPKHIALACAAIAQGLPPMGERK
jgi:DNA-binding transcriptional regulator YiaG